MEREVKDRNEWFEEVERAYGKLKIVERPYAPPHAAVAVEAEDVLCCLGLHPHISASDWLVINLDEVRWRMSCYFYGGSRIASIHSAPDRGVCNWSVGSMTLTRRYDGEPIVRVELDTSVSLDVSVNGLCGDTVSADVTADAYIEDIKYCPFCGEEL